MPSSRSGLRGPALVDGHLHQPGDRVVERLERVDRQDAVLDVLEQEAALGVVAAVAERHLGQVVGAEAEEVGVVRRSRRPSGRRAAPRSSCRTCSRPRCRRRPRGRPRPRPRAARASPTSSFTCPTSGIMILAIGLPPALRTAICALRIARVWIFTKSGIISPRRQPRRPSIGFCSCSDLIVASSSLSSSDAPPCSSARVTLTSCSSRFGQELVERRVDQPDDDRQAVHRLEDALEVALLEDLELGHRGVEGRDGLLLVGGERVAGGDAWPWPGWRLLATRIAPRTISSRSPSRNMCSVRHRPMPCAP